VTGRKVHATECSSVASWQGHGRGQLPLMVYCGLNKIKLAFDAQHKIFILT